MAGHSKWANIQHRKSRQDARKAKIFTKLVREITISARLGGSDPDGNPRLRAAVAAAREVNMPADNIQRAIDKGTGAAEGEAFEEVTYEGYGPGGVAILIEGLTDNRNRTTSEIRNLFSRGGGSMAESGAVNWQFERKGLVTVSKDGIDEERAAELAIESGAEDYEDGGDVWAISTAGTELHAVADALAASGVEPKSVEWVMVPTTEVEPETGDSDKVLSLIENLEDHDDVQKVWTNANPESMTVGV